MGSRGYALAAGLEYQPGDVILEVGADRGEGSTGFLASLGPTVISIDIDPENLSRAGQVPNLLRWQGRAEELLPSWDSVIGHRIRFAWLDGHDWPYDGQDEADAFEYHKLYRDRGQEFTREASQASHQLIAELILPWVPQAGVIAFDDTSRTEAGWTGKGGTAVPWLLEQGCWILHDADDWVAVSR